MMSDGRTRRSVVTGAPIVHSSPEELKSLFKEFDADGSGQIALNEFEAILTRTNVEMTRAELVDLTKQVDADNDGDINYEEFVQMMALANDKITSTMTAMKQAYLDPKAVAAGAQDVIWYREDMIIARELLKNEKVVQEAISSLWVAMLELCGCEGEGRISRQDYQLMSRKLYLILKLQADAVLPSSWPCCYIFRPAWPDNPVLAALYFYPMQRFCPDTIVVVFWGVDGEC